MLIVNARKKDSMTIKNVVMVKLAQLVKQNMDNIDQNPAEIKLL